MDSIEILLQRLEFSLNRKDELNTFELAKISQNIEYAQKLILQSELNRGVRSSEHVSERNSISKLQESLALKREALDQIVRNDLQAEEAQKALPKIDEKQAKAAVQSTQEHILQNHREAQESISDDLLKMAKTLRESQETFGAAISADNELIEKTGEALHVNADKMKRTGGRLSQYSRKSGWSWLYTYLAIFVAFLAFFVTIGIMKVV